MSNERAAFQAEVAQVEQWWKVRHSSSHLALISRHQSPRFARVIRPYTAAQVVSKRGTMPIQYPSNVQAKKLWNIFSEHAKRGTPSHTYGA
jgi:isocitrate lyase